MFRDLHRIGELSMEWVAILVIAAAIVLVVVLGIANNAGSKGGSVRDWIGNLSTP